MDSNFWYKLLEDVIVLAVSAIVPAVLALIVVMIRKKFAEFKNIYPEYGYLLEQAASFAVKAAEEANFAGFIDDKRAYALEIAQKYLDDHKVKLSLEVIDAAIEAAVYDVMNKERIANEGLVKGVV
jgi:hypothetical protein